MIDFPANPTLGQQFTAAGVTWTYDGTKWTASGLGVAYLPLAGGTMLGPIVLAADPAAALQPATKQYVDGASFGGFVNKFRNGTMDVWQRGTPINVTAGSTIYTADGWLANATGATLSVAESSMGSGLNATAQSMVLTGAAGLTGGSIQQRIESFVAAPLAGKRITVQFRVRNATGAAWTPRLQTYYPASAADNWTGPTTDLGPVNLQSVPVNASGSMVVAYTFDVSPNAYRGYLVQLYFDGALNGAGNNIAVSEADIRVTPGWPVGLCANPPPPELRPVATELAFCQRYYLNANALLPVWGYGAAAGSIAYAYYSAPVTMRAAPTANGSWAGLVNATNGTITGLGDLRSFRSNISSSAAGGFAGNFTLSTLSAEL